MFLLRMVDFDEERERLISLLRRVEEFVLGSSMSIEGTAKRQQVPLLVILNP